MNLKIEITVHNFSPEQHHGKLIERPRLTGEIKRIQSVDISDSFGLQKTDRAFNVYYLD